MTEIADTAKAGGRNMTVFGVIAIILGVLAMLTPTLTGISIAMLLGWLVVAAGVIRMIWAFQAGSVGRGLLMFAIGGLTLLCGLALVANPLFATGIVTIMLAVYLVVDGVLEIAAGFRRRPASGSGWMLFGGIVSVLLGVMIWRQFPMSGVWAVGTLFGIKMIFSGWALFLIGRGVRGAAKEAQAA